MSGHAERRVVEGPIVGVDLGDHWLAKVTVAEVEGRPIVTKLEIVPRPDGEIPPQGLTARDLRALKLRDAVRHGMEIERDLWLDGETFFSKESARRIKEAAETPRGRARDEDFYAEIAEKYLGALLHAPSRPVARLAEEIGKTGHKVSPATVRDWVHLARRHGWLTEGRRGLPGARPTERLEEWRKSRDRKQKDNTPEETGDDTRRTE